MSALRASNPPEPVPPTSPAAYAAQSGVRVVIPGTDRTYENREVLRGMGLRWDPPTHAWHGVLAPRERSLLRERFGLAVRAVVALEAFPVGMETSRASPATPSPPKPPRGPSPSISGALASSSSHRVVHDGSRSRAEARVALRDASDELSDPWAPIVGSRFSQLDVTSGLPDDSRDADERAAERQLRDLCARVRAARAVLTKNPGLAEAVGRDSRKTAWFYARWGITAGRLRRGVPSVFVPGGGPPTSQWV